GCDVDDLGIFETHFFQPLFQRGYARDKPDVIHSRIAVVRDEDFATVAIDDQRFQNQLAAATQGIAQFNQVIERRTAVIQHAHRKHRVEEMQAPRQLFYAERQHADASVADIALQRKKLCHEQQRGIDADHQIGPGTAHAPAVIAAAATDIKDFSAGQRCDLIFQSVPLPVGAPFGVDVDAKNIEGTLAPGMQLHQRLCQRIALLLRQAVGPGYTNAVAVEIDSIDGQIW